MYLRAFIEACEAFGWVGGPEFKTLIVPMANKRERRNAEWAEGRHRYSMPFQNLNAEQYASIRQMFQVCRGQLHAFLYRDPLDNTATDEPFAFGDGTRETFQLSKISTIDGVSYVRNIYAFGDDDDVTAEVAGSPATFTLDRDRGLITFDSPPGDMEAITWSGPFAVWVRFANDWLPFSIDNRLGAGDYARNGTVDLIEIAAPPEESSS